MDELFEIACASRDGSRFSIWNEGDGRPLLAIRAEGGIAHCVLVGDRDLPRLIEALQSCVRATQVEEAA